MLRRRRITIRLHLLRSVTRRFLCFYCGHMLGGRAAWLGRPWFFAAVVVLALNDHVFKAVWPGWATGKLSDLAGVVVVGTLAAVLFGATPGVVLAGLAFGALKTVPGVAEFVAPVLGGVTLRDASDLLALAVLPALWCGLRRERPDQRQRNRRGWQALGLVAAVLATTATSQSPPHYVSLGSAAGAIYASVDPGDGFDDAYLTSTDGGRSWTTVSRESVHSASINWAPDYAGSEQAPQVCAADGTCFRLSTDSATLTRHVDRSTAGSPWQLDGVLDRGPAFSDDLAIDTSASDHVVVLGLDRMVYSRSSDGNWVQVDLGPVAAPPQWQRSVVGVLGNQGGVMGMFGLGLVLSLLLAPWTGMKWALGVLNVLAGGLVWVWAILGSPLSIAQLTVAWFAILVMVLALMRLTRWLERRSRRQPAASPEPGDGE